jgi:hypothetical protein
MKVYTRLFFGCLYSIRLEQNFLLQDLNLSENTQDLDRAGALEVIL